MISKPYPFLALAAAVIGGGLAAEAAARAGGSPFESEAQFQKRITVRVTGMPLDQLFPG
jgi:hypothetical protein